MRNCLVHKSCVVFRHKSVSSAQGPLFPLDPQDLELQLSFTKHVTRAYLHHLVLPFSRLSNSGAVVKSVVMIFILEPRR